MKSIEANEMIMDLMEGSISRKELSEALGVCLGSVSNALNYDEPRLDSLRVKMLRHLGVDCEVRKEIFINSK